MMSIVFVIFSMLSLSVFAHSVPKTSRVFSKAHQRTTTQVLRNRGYSEPMNANMYAPIKGREIASEKREELKKIPWKVK